MKILMIEDTKHYYAFFMKEMKKVEGVEVFLVEQGNKAYSACRHIKPDLVVCDYMLPGAKGDEIVEMIRHFEAGHSPESNVPIIACSSGLTYCKEMMKAGADAYITKDCLTYSNWISCTETFVEWFMKLAKKVIDESKEKREVKDKEEGSSHP